ncbi:hypothetical protein N7523_003263 [Penicillium sp. IBT 18751x]|nr:hypothetical protein N7523_003263 [Penicillium sp. IBT 18751x]
MMEMTTLTDSRNDDHYANSPIPRSEAETSSKNETLAVKIHRRSICLDSWLFECIALAFSIACFIAIVIVLLVYDGKRQPDMAHGLTLNTIVSVLATGCKSALVLVISESISQLKWPWFQTPRQSQNQLVTIQRFDAASRGPLGSLMIIIHHRAQSLVSFGAAIIIFLLTFDPFMQQLLTYPVRPVMSRTDSASTPQRLAHLPFDQDSSSSSWNSALAQALWASGDFIVTPKCSSGNCTWDAFSSVSVCSRCEDVTSTIGFDCDLPSVSDIKKAFNISCFIDLGKGTGHFFNVLGTTDSDIYSSSSPSLNFPSKIIWEPFAYSLYRSSHLPNYTLNGVTNPLWTIAYTQFELDGDRVSENESITDAIRIKNAMACAVSTCLRDYHVSVTDGTPSVRSENFDFGTIYENPNPSPDDDAWSRCWKPGDANTAVTGTDKSKFAFCDETMWDFESDSLGFIPDAQNLEWDFDHALDTWSLSGSNGDEIPNSNPILQQYVRVGFERVITRMADSLTKLGLETTNHSVIGTSYVPTAFVSVRWPWVILPGILLVTGALFLVITMVISKKSRAPLWKSSALAPYYHGVEGYDDENDDELLLTASAMERKSEGEVVLLQRSENNGRLVLQKQGTLNKSSGQMI